ncbi:MAG: T9SS type A sorting domain-containing protein [Mangrovibacterium sp.]
MKKILSLLLVALALAAPAALQAQSKVRFEYDGSGNRKLRTITLSTSPTMASKSQMLEPEELKTELGDQEIRIYPNPTKGLLRIDIPNLDGTNITLDIFDSHGRLLIRKDAQAIGNQLDLSAYPSGMYLLLIRTENDKQEWKIIKE